MKKSESLPVSILSDSLDSLPGLRPFLTPGSLPGYVSSVSWDTLLHSPSFPLTCIPGHQSMSLNDVCCLELSVALPTWSDQGIAEHALPAHGPVSLSAVLRSMS